MTSGNRTPVADQGSGGHSVFAYQLLKELRQNAKPYISTQEIYTRIAPIVSNNSEQTPLCRPIRNTGDQGGEFIFVASSAAAIEKPVSGSGKVAAAPVKLDDTGLSAERERLEQERNELEKIKAEVAERQSLEEERLRIAAEKKQILAMGKRPAVSPGTDQKISNSLGMEFVYIQPGTFMMGSPSSEPQRESDETQHQVTISKPFYMQTTEVTQGQWRKVMGNNPSSFKDCGDDCPVEQVSWNDVQEFVRKLNNLEGTDKYRLPTEAQWEYAARAGSTTAFANGGITETGCGHDANLAAMGWYCGNANSKPHPVAQKQSNAWGLYDMHGNVWEWCQERKGDYPTGQVTDPQGPSSGSYLVIRGGSWADGAWLARATFRYGYPPRYWNSNLGVRLLRTY